MNEVHEYGFRWGPVNVTRLAKFFRNGVSRGATHALALDTDHHKVEVYISPTGRSVRVYKDGRELL